jgi:hypothetical protein
MESRLIKLIDKTQGVPMISCSFDAQTLITLIAHYRHVLLKTFSKASEYLMPEAIEEPFRHRNAQLGIEYPMYDVLSPAEEEAVTIAVKSIVNIVPGWAVYFSLPMQYKKLTKNKSMVSLTNHHIPQVIFLGDKAFKSEYWLVEVIIHETAHIWLGMLCEMDSFHDETNSQHYTLPSGTKNKDARGVIFASHFAACTLVYYQKKNTIVKLSPEEEERFTWLKVYYSGCMEQLMVMRELKPTGKDIVRVMGEKIRYG